MFIVTPHSSAGDLGLSATLERGWRVPLATYARMLWTPTPRIGADDLLTAALVDELERVGPDPAVTAAALRGWQRHRTLITGHHACPSHGPIFLAMDRIATAGCADDIAPIIAAWSGIPLSNRAHPRHLCFAGDPGRVVRPGTAAARRLAQAERDRSRTSGEGERRVALLPVHMQRRSMYRLPTPPDLADAIADLQPAAAALMAPLSEHYTSWAMQTAAAITHRALGRRVVIIDLNRLVAGYLRRVMHRPDHAIGRLFHDAGARAAWQAQLPDEPWFTIACHARRRESQTPVTLGVDVLAGAGVSWPVDPAVIDARLADGMLCPALLAAYACLVGEGVHCLGGPRQVEYVGRFVAAWRRLDWPVALRDAPTLVSGRVVDDGGRGVFPLDLALDGVDVASVVPDDTPMHRLWQPAGFTSMR